MMRLVIAMLILAAPTQALFVQETSLDGHMSLINPGGLDVALYINGNLTYEGNSTVRIPIPDGTHAYRVLNATNATLLEGAVTATNLTAFFQALVLRVAAVEATQTEVAANATAEAAAAIAALDELKALIAALPAPATDYAKASQLDNTLSGATFGAWAANQERNMTAINKGLDAQASAVNAAQGMVGIMVVLMLLAGALMVFAFMRVRRVVQIAPNALRHVIALSYAMGLEGSTALEMADEVLGLPSQTAIQEEGENVRGDRLDAEIGGVIRVD